MKSDEKLKKLRWTHINQLMVYLQTAENEGWYYGNANQFYKRHKEIKDWLLQLQCDKDIKEGT